MLILQREIRRGKNLNEARKKLEENLKTNLKLKSSD